MITIKKELDFEELKDMVWSSEAIDTLQTIEQFELEDELMEFINDVFSKEIPLEEDVNDFLRDSEYVLGAFGIKA